MTRKSGDNTARSTNAPTTSRTRLAARTLCRVSVGREPVERQREQLLHEGMRLGGTVDVHENTRVDAEALADLEGVGDLVEARRRHGEEHLVDDVFPVQDLLKVRGWRRAPGPRRGLGPTSDVSRLRRPRTTQPASGYCWRAAMTRAARSSVPTTSATRVQRSPCPARRNQALDQAALGPEPDAAHGGKEGQHAPVDLALLGPGTVRP